jgi:hypothetical protein
MLCGLAFAVAVLVLAVLARTAFRGASSTVTSAGRASPEPVYRAGSLMEAQLVLDALNAGGVRATVRNEHVASLVGEIPQSAAWPEVWLSRASDWDVAVAIVRKYEERRDTDNDTEVVCSACGEHSPSNFELCWRCRAPLDVPASDGQGSADK